MLDLLQKSCLRAPNLNAIVGLGVIGANVVHGSYMSTKHHRSSPKCVLQSYCEGGVDWNE
eukprot:scaffold1605_cov141-Cylindrotheca_fusiformis.AAC.32